MSILYDTHSETHSCFESVSTWLTHFQSLLHLLFGVPATLDLNLFLMFLYNLAVHPLLKLFLEKLIDW